ncbi:MAG: HAMP domain-containing protein [Rhodospirillales bacterium]|nr:HAMP domain-containing protein [Rhodospirillales bacterium]MBO6788097.1 HAMP domain-containing protein [Rhodospirillales bacterium]
MKISTRIIAAFVAVLTLMAIVGIAGWVSLNKYSNAVHEANAIDEVVGAVRNTREFLLKGVVEDDVAQFENALAAVNMSLEVGQKIELQPDVIEAINALKTALSTYKELHEQNAARLAEMTVLTDDISKIASSIRDSQVENYARISAAASEAEAERSARQTTKALGDNLVKATLSARQAEALYQLTRDEAQEKAANRYIKEMFLTALRFKKAAAGTEEAEAVGQVAKAVNAYRVAFGELASAIKEGRPTFATAQALEEASESINTITAEIGARQQAAFEEATARSHELAVQAAQAVAAQDGAGQLVTLVQKLRLNEAVFRSEFASEESEKAMGDLLRDFFTVSLRLKKAIAGTPGEADVNQIATKTVGYRKFLAEVAGALKEQSAADATMSREANKVVDSLNDLREQSLEAARQGQSVSVQTIIWVSILATIVGGFLAYYISRSISVPLNAMTGAMQRLAENDLSVDVPGVGRKDEVGDMADTLEIFRQNALEVEKLRNEQDDLKKKQEREAEERRLRQAKEKEEAEEQARAERRDAMNKLADTFEKTVRGVVGSITEAAEILQQTSQQLTGTAEQTLSQATTVAAAAEEASVNVQTVSSAVEELNASIQEIGSNASNSTSTVAEGVKRSNQTNSLIQGLSDSVTKIGEIVQLIDDIAEQTNMLALNATIESARAGEAGKGFSVVANEVKELAGQTTKATEEIAAQVSRVQTDTNEVVRSIQEISETIGIIDKTASSIAAAVEQQSAATREISRNTQEVSNGTQNVSSNIQGVTQSVGVTTEAATKVGEAASKVTLQAKELNQQVEQFIAQIRADAG